MRAMSELVASDWISLIGVGVAAAAVVFGGLQVKHARDERREIEELSIRGVSVSWHAVESPDHADLDGGNARWRYEFIVNNPGRMPIDNVTVAVNLGVGARRLRYSGRLEDVSRTLHFAAPVIPGGTSRQWNRTIVLPFEERAALRDMQASVTFRDVKNVERTNTWPRR
jgi:hypothetical protein